MKSPRGLLQILNIIPGLAGRVSPLWILLTLLMLPDGAEAQFTYVVNNGAVTITGGCQSGAVNIPSTIDGLPVTSIGDEAFYNCTSLTSVTIPDSVTRIGDSAFEDCDSLTAITVDANNSTYASLDGILFDKSLSTLVECPTGKAGSYTIPNSVTRIGDSAFYDCDLTSVTIPNSVTRIGDYAFNGCGLTSVTIGKGVTSIGNGAFSECGSLTSVTIPNSVTRIGNGAFYNCRSLTSITIPDSVTGIGDSAFEDCTSLTAITVDANNSTYASLDGILFDKSLSTLVECPTGKAGSYTIPNSVTRIGDSAFYDCDLTSVTIPNSVTRIGDYAFNGCGLTSVTIGKGVTSIGNGAFGFCASLTSITIPDSVTTIGQNAFFYCASLRAVYFQGDAPVVGLDPFYAANNATVYYLPGTAGWSPTFGGRPTAFWVLANPVILGVGPSFGVQANQFGFLISWATNIPVVVEATTTVANPTWSPVKTNKLIGGTSYCSDPDWSRYPTRFYRLRSP